MLADAELRASALAVGVRGLSSLHLHTCASCSWCSCGALSAMAVRNDLSKTIRRIVRFFYWFPKSLSSSRRRTVKLLWKSPGKSVAMFLQTFFLLKNPTKNKGKKKFVSIELVSFSRPELFAFFHSWRLIRQNCKNILVGSSGLFRQRVPLQLYNLFMSMILSILFLPCFSLRNVYRSSNMTQITA